MCLLLSSQTSYPSFCLQSEPEFEDEPSPSSSPPSKEFPAPTKQLNQRLALASVAVAVGMFVATRGAGAGPNLNQLAAGAMQYDEAIRNGKPTVVEFYADWCVVCREMAKEVYLAEEVSKTLKPKTLKTLKPSLSL